ncbi:N-methylhydantoinase B [Monaibacterium marinum]|uniref:N-methylhydantoinase B n=1 Tax=Pontivivens marinum TaxID=1690039 RepID=A0A2C9CSY3_9RHOB|nr:hydantoinase B/oxoprolinase family protein [Monaibacterium marinum]SOH94310.1 N-methylhydantoinase B [Monaibacterium marinum]
MREETPLDPIRLQVIWSRLASVADEIATTLERTAFSLIVRDNQDYACALYDADGTMLAQSNQCTPGQAGSTPTVIREMLATYPAETLEDGDILICNDPWVGAGHAPDVFVATPIFYLGRLAGFACTCAHHADMGGRLGATDARDVYEEGVIIPVSKLWRAGVRNDELYRLLARNVRMSEKVLGDISAQIAANRVGAKGIVGLMQDFDLDQLETLAQQITDATEAMFRKALSRLPVGEAHSEVFHEITNENGERLKISVKLTVQEGEVHLDFTGTSPQVAMPINAVFNITRAYAVFPFIATLCPDLPMNAGAFRPVKLFVPEGTVLNPTFPAPGMYRSLLSYFTVEALMGAIYKVAPDLAMAPSGTYPLWTEKFAGVGPDGREFLSHYNAQGGQGAFRDRDGNSAVVFPGNIATTSVELFELEAPFRVISRELRPDTGGAGKFRGGLGQETVMQCLNDTPVQVAFSGGRLVEPAMGRETALSGTQGVIQIRDDAPFTRSGRGVMEKGDICRFAQPGGGGFGNPAERDCALIARDLQLGYVTAEAATQYYGVCVADDGSVYRDGSAV